jgi:hypothetical protein
MTDGPGKATGPQRKPRVKQEAAPPPPKHDPIPERDERDRKRAAYDACCHRIIEQLELARERFDEMPQGIRVADLSEDLMSGLMDLEKRITNVRVDLDQIGCGL